MQTEEKGFSLDMNRLGDNDAHDRVLCCVYRPAAAAVNLFAHPENHTNNFPDNLRESAQGENTL